MLKPSALLVLRLAFVIVFGWFGTQQLLHPGDWIGLIPAGVVSATSLSAATLVLVNGGAELLGALLLLLGWWLPLVATLGALHVFSIVVVVGFSAVGIRDIGLALALVALALGSRRSR